MRKQITYRQATSGRLMEVGDWETVRRSILERSGWVLAEEPELESDPEQVEEPVDNTAASFTVDTTVSDTVVHAGVEHLLDALLSAGFMTADDIINADIDALTAVSGIGKATAKKLQKAAGELTDG